MDGNYDAISDKMDNFADALHEDAEAVLILVAVRNSTGSRVAVSTSTRGHRYELSGLVHALARSYDDELSFRFSEEETSDGDSEKGANNP